MEHALDAEVATAAIPWLGFPRSLVVTYDNDRDKALKQAEQRAGLLIGYEDKALTKKIVRPYRQQDEYLEWVPLKRNNKVVGFAFTAEGPEYWEYLASIDRDAVLGLYKDFTGRIVRGAVLGSRCLGRARRR
jgi:hypothetical protein